MNFQFKRLELLCSQQYVNGQWQDSSTGGRYEVRNPANDQVIGYVPDSQAEDAERALEAAERAFPAWKNASAKERKNKLRRWHQLVLENADDLAKLISLEQGKPLAEALGEVQYGASYIDWFAEEASRTYGDLLPNLLPGKQLSAIKEPVGVVAVITPWNFPLAMIARKIAPALAVGCTVVAKPSEDTPLTALALAKLAEEAGIPPGVLNIITVSRSQAAAAVAVWLEDERVRKLTFTGSTEVGKYLAKASAGTLKKLSLELGGNAPFIVFDDADLGAAVDGLLTAKFRNGGQTCVSPNRVYVQSGVYQRFAELLRERVAALKIGPADVAGSQIGPMINGKAVDKIETHVCDALEKGAVLLTGGRRYRDEVADGPFYFLPTVLGEASHEMQLAQEETFGPVVPLFRFDSEEEVIRVANDTPFGLAAYFYSQNIQRVHRVARALETGIVGINEGALASEAAPFGGVKASGYGREGSKYGLDDYLHIKYLCQGGL